MKKLLIFAFALLALITMTLSFASCGNKCEHSYFSDCDEICDECGEAREITAEHNYYGDCDSSCHSCGKKRETTAEHSWQDATCSRPEGCRVCGMITGEILAHSYTAKGYDDHYHYQMCLWCEMPDEDTKEKHVLGDEYTCECGAEYTVKQEGEIETYGVVELYNSDELLIKEIGYELGEPSYYHENYYNENGEIIKGEHYDFDGELLSYFLYEYNENGDLMKEDLYDSDGKIIAYELYHYDENGFLIKDESFDGNGALEEYVLYTNDEKGNLIKKESFESDGTRDSYHLYEYDEGGNLSKDEEYNSDGALEDVKIWEYDENNNLRKMKIEEYDEDGALEYTEAVEYNEKGDCVKEEYVYSDGTADRIEYDENGRKIKETQVMSDGFEFAISYEYDENGKRKKEIYEDSTGYEYVLSHEYDENGNCTQTNLDSSIGYRYEIKYEYDENGNCVKEECNDSNGSKYIIEHQYDEDGNKIKSIKTNYDNEGNLSGIEVEEADHNFSDDWKCDKNGHYHICINEGCRETDEIIEHTDNDADNKCDICSYDFGYVYDTSTKTYMAYSEDGLEAALALGGTVALSDDIEMTEYLVVSSDAVLDLNGKAITATDSFTAVCLFIVESGTLTVMDSQEDGRIEANIDQIIDVRYDGALVINGGSIASDGYTIYVDGKITVNGGTISYVFGGGNDGEIFVTITGGTILNLNLPSLCDTTITGGSFVDNPASYLSNEYYAIYDSATQMWTVVENDGTIDTFGELQAAVNRGGSVRLGASIDLGSGNLEIPEEICVNLDLAGYTLSSAGDAIHNLGTLTVNGGAIHSEGAYAIMNIGTLTVEGGTLSTVNLPAIHNEGALIVNGGTFTDFDPTEYVDMTTHTVTQTDDGKWTVTAKQNQDVKQRKQEPAQSFCAQG